MRVRLTPLHVALILGLILAFCAGSMLAVAESARISKSAQTLNTHWIAEERLLADMM